MKKLFVPALVLAAALIFYAVHTTNRVSELSSGSEIKVLLLYNPANLTRTMRVLDAYESVLQEEGVPYSSMSIHQLPRESGGNLANRFPAVVLPDSILQHVPPDFEAWIKAYLESGGNLLVVYDVGIKDRKGFYLDASVLSEITGFNAITYATAGTAAYDYGSVRFSSEANRVFFQIPSGKTVEKVVLSSYNYGRLNYPFAKIRPVRDIPQGQIYAHAITRNKEKIPALVLTDYAKGRVLYANLPLGQLKANADDLPLRAVLRTFLFSIVGMPHVMNVEKGLGGIVINWHIDSNAEYRTLPAMQKMGLLRTGVPLSLHVTAGDFFEHPGDGAGFDACGKGRPLLEQLKPYGIIGSHGGWGHNWFANNIDNGTFAKKEIRQYIQKNSECLEKITGYKIVEYSAPDGVHPQPAATSVLEDLGFIAYYSTGDTGSTPNRTFFDGRMVSSSVIAFPIMPFGRSASLYEMNVLDKRTDREIREWLVDLLAYTAQNRTIRLVYSHPYNIELYPRVVRSFMDRVETLQRSKTITVTTMTAYASFFLRFLKTTYSFNREEGRVRVALKNPDGLEGICIALPKRNYRRPLVEQTTLQEDAHFYYLTMVRNDREQSFTVAAY